MQAARYVCGLDALSFRIGWYKPEHCVGARERLLGSIAVAVRSLHNVDSFACLGRQARRVAHDHANRFPAVEDIPENLAADLPRRSGDDDHGFPQNLKVKEPTRKSLTEDARRL